MIPAPFRSSWCATDIGDHRPCRYTYERYPIESVPPLDVESFTGDFAWRGGLGDVLDGQTAAMNGLTGDLAEAGLSLPIDFVTYMTRSNLYRCLDEVSGTCCWTSLSMPLPSPIEADARMVRFFRDQQDCVLWYLYLRPDGESFIVHCYRDLETEAEVRSSGVADEIENLPDFENDPDYEIFWCAPTVEIFATANNPSKTLTKTSSPTSTTMHKLPPGTDNRTRRHCPPDRIHCTWPSSSTSRTPPPAATPPSRNASLTTANRAPRTYRRDSVRSGLGRHADPNHQPPRSEHHGQLPLHHQSDRVVWRRGLPDRLGRVAGVR